MPYFGYKQCMGYTHSRPVLFILVCVISCQSDISVNPGTAIECRTQAECPAPLVCNTDLGRCLQATETYVPGRFLTETLVLTPGITTPTGVVALSFRTQGNLVAPPTVELALATRAPFGVSRESDSEYSYRLDLSGLGAANLAGSWPILGSIRDVSGGGETDVPLGTLLIDDTAPAVRTADAFYTAGVDNTLRVVEAMGEDTTFTVVFTTSEPLAEVPEVRAVCVGQDLVLNRRPGEVSPTLFTFSNTLSVTDVALDSVCPLVATLTDEAGNVGADADIGVSLIVDRTSPDAGSAIDVSLLEHLRVPWGAIQTAGAPGQFIVSSSLTVDDAPLSVPIATAAFEQAGETLRLVRAYASPAGGVPLGESEPSTGGWAPIQLFASDLTNVYLAVVDAAGNESSRVAVPSHQWVATMGDKQIGSTLRNPNVLEARPYFVPALLQEQASFEIVAGSNLREQLNSGAEASVADIGGADAWRLLDEALATPSSRINTALAYDSARGRVVMFGGAATNAGCDLSASPACSATWEWNGQRWIRVTPSDPEGDGNPAGRSQTAMAYDSRRGRVVLFGGGQGPELQETWEWDGKSWERRCDGRPASDVCSVLPHERRQHAMAYDYERGVVVVFGGRRASSGGEDCDRAQYMCGDTWEWDGSDWTPRCFEGGRCAGEPPPRTDHAMAYDPTTGMVLVYGGQDLLSSSCSGTGSNNNCLGTYGWDGRSWTRLSDTDTDPDGDGDPGAREFFVMAHDRQRELTVLFGGDEQTWEWNGSTWTRGPDAPSTFVPTLQFAGAYDSARGEVVVFGGSPMTLTGCRPENVNFMNWCLFDQTWGYDGSAWTLRQSGDRDGGGSPAVRSFHGLAYDSARSRLVLVGGNTSTFPDSFRQDVWAFRGGDWLQQTDIPEIRFNHITVYHPFSDTIVVHGDSSDADETWEFDGNWTLACDGNAGCTSPGGRDSMAATYYASESHRSVAIFGGVNNTDCSGGCNDLWEWDNNGSGVWTELCDGGVGCPGPAARSNAALAYDANRDVLVLFGGNRFAPSASDCAGQEFSNTCWLDDVWEWDGSRWTDVTPAGLRPPGRTGHSLVYDSRLRKVLLFGGQAATLTDCGPGDVYCDDLWAWDGESWETIPTVDLFGTAQPSPRSYHRAAWDSNNSQMVLFGGHSILSTGVWGYEHDGTSRPGAVMRTSLAFAEIPDVSSIERISASVLAAGRSPAGGGARLGVWSLGQWSLAAEHVAEGGLSGTDCDVTNPQDACWLRWSTSSPGEIADIIFSDEQLVGIGITPRTPNGRGFGTLRLHYGEIRVRYSD